MNETRETICQCRNKSCNTVMAWSATTINDRKEHVCFECGSAIRIIRFANNQDEHYVEKVASHYSE